MGEKNECTHKDKILLIENELSDRLYWCPQCNDFVISFINSHKTGTEFFTKRVFYPSSFFSAGGKDKYIVKDIYGTWFGMSENKADRLAEFKW